MTIQTTRAILLRNLLRTGDRRRIARLLDRLHLADLSRLLLDLTELELRRAAAVLFDDVRVGRSVAGLSTCATEILIAAAQDHDAGRALAHLGPWHAAQILSAAGAERRRALLGVLGRPVVDDIIRALPRSARPRRSTEDGVGSAFRLRRLFA